MSGPLPTGNTPRHKSRVPGLSVQSLVTQFGSALCPAAGKNLPSIRRGHALAETMFLFSVQLFRLISSKHEKTPLRLKKDPLKNIISYLSAACQPYAPSGKHGSSAGIDNKWSYRVKYTTSFPI